MSYNPHTSHPQPSGAIAPASFVDVLRLRALHDGDKLAFVYLKDGEREEASLTFCELERRARTIAAELQAMAAPGDRVLLLYPSGLEYVCAFFACLFAGLVAVPVYPPQAQRNKLGRLHGVIVDCAPRCVLATADILTFLHADSQFESLFSGMRELATDKIDGDHCGRWNDPAIEASTLAFLQYTSGSTGQAKGVMVSHANLMHNQAMIERGFATSRDSVVVGWLPLYHDMGLIGNVLHPIYIGATAVLMSPMAFLQKPLRWLQAVAKYRGTVSGGPNFAYQLCADRIGVEQSKELDLSCWTTAFNGAEPIRAQTLRDFQATFANSGFSATAFLPCYGLAEATLFVSGAVQGSTPRCLSADSAALREHRFHDAAEGDSVELVSSGAVTSNRVCVVDARDGSVLPDAQVGEIWLASPSVARGYWQGGAANEESFRGQTSDGLGPWLRTGDYGFVRDGELYVTGRLKELIIVRGRNHYPQDIERTVQATDAMLTPGAGAAFSIEVGGEECLIVVQEVQRSALRHIDPEFVEREVRAAVSETHELRLHELVLIKPMRLSKTSSGKIKRRECRELYLSRALDPIERAAALASVVPISADVIASRPASDPAESMHLQRLRRMLIEVLRVPGVEPRVDAAITALGLDSLAAIELQHRIESEFQRQCPLEAILAGPTLRELHEILKAAPASTESILPISAASQGPLSYNQESMWFLHSLQPDSAANNVALPVRIRSTMVPALLEQAWQCLADTHSILRTRYSLVDNEPVQTIDDAALVHLELIDARIWAESRLQAVIAQNAAKPWSLETRAPFRLQLFQRGESDFVLLLLAHHISVDLHTVVMLLRLLLENYASRCAGETLTVPGTSYSSIDYSRWQRDLVESDRGRLLWQFWHARLAGPLPILQLPTDRPRPRQSDHSGAALNFRIPVDLSQALREAANRHGVTLYTMLITAYMVFLHKYADIDELCVGTPVSARSRAEFSQLGGFCVNTVVLRAEFSAHETFQEFLQHMRNQVLDALAHRDLPIAYLVEKLCPARDANSTPLFQTLFALHDPHELPQAAAFALGEAGKQLTVAGLSLESCAQACSGSQFELSLFMADDPAGLAARFEYRDALFDPSRIEAMARGFEHLLSMIVRAPQAQLAALSVQSAEQGAALLASFRGPVARYDDSVGIVALIESQAIASPQTLAVISGEQQLDYAELLRRAGILAGLLRERGVCQGHRVGVCLPRGLDRFVAILAVLKAGATYVAMDPGYPAARLQLIADLADASLVVSTNALALEPVSTKAIVLPIEEMWSSGVLALNDPASAEAGLAVYLLFTSGSTGTPKGVLMNQGALLNLLHWQQEEMPLQRGDRVSQFASINFDVSFQEIFASWCFGATLVEVSEEQRHDPSALLRLLDDRGVRRAYLPGVVLQQLAQTAMTQASVPRELREIVCAGEQLVLSDEVRALFARLPGASLHNHYGPTESHVVTHQNLCGDSSCWPQWVPIGRPISNARIYLLDRAGHAVPAGVPGELCIGGACLADGYWGRGDLTAERFQADPYASTPGSRMYRTGDLARVRPDGSFEYLGRRDQQIQLRGFRVELGEIEAALVAQPEIVESVVLLREDQPGSPRLVAYVVARSEQVVLPEMLRAALKHSLPDYLVPAQVVVLESLPLTANGKVDKRALPAPLASTTPGQGTAPRNSIEARVAKIWNEVLAPARIDVHENFFEAGGYSLLATKLISRLRIEFSIELPVAALFEAPTIAGLAARVSNATALTLPAPVRVPRDGGLPLSYAQQRLWFLEQLEGPSANYNMPAAFRLRGPLQVAALRESFREIVQRHETLRTRFVDTNSGPLQIIGDGAEFDVAIVDVETGDVAAQLREHATQPFALDRGSLMRVELLRVGADEHLLLVNLHHIIADGWSIGVLVRELNERYARKLRGDSSELAPLPIQYADFACWQRQWHDAEFLARQSAYWLHQLAGLPPLLEIPGDRPRPPVQSLRGGVYRFRFPAALQDRLVEFNAKNSTTLLMSLMAAYQVLMARYAGQADVAIGTPVANRPRPELEGLIGFFVNTLVIRNSVDPALSFLQHLARVRETLLAAQAHEDLPFEQLIEQLKPARSLSHAPLVQVMFLLHDAATDALVLPGVDIEREENGFAIARFDLALNVEAREDGLHGWFDYSADLFDESRIAMLAESYLRLLDAATEDASRVVSSLPLIGADQAIQQLQRQDELPPARMPQRLVHELFEEQARRNADSPAVVFGDESLSYAELDGRANELADRLQDLGVGPEDHLGVWMERSTNLLACMLAIWKCGATYVPMDPAYPKDRLDYIVADAKLRYVLSDSQLRASFVAPVGELVLVDQVARAARGQTKNRRRPAAHALHPAYVIYTSGSTGKPKGVQVLQGGLSELLLGLVDCHACGAGDSMPSLASHSFGISFVELLLPLLVGGHTRILARQTVLDTQALCEQLEKVTLAHLVPSLMRRVLDHLEEHGDRCDYPQLRRVFVGGDAVAPSLLDAMMSRFAATDVVEFYGQTETTILSCQSLQGLQRDPGNVIGQRLPHAQAYILDAAQQLLPQGSVGEIHIGGHAIARGYVGNAEQTAAQFIPHPFSHASGSRLYRTGDLGRLLADGRIEYVGRADFQVNIRGFRVELGEIEAVLREVPFVHQAILSASEDDRGEKKLVAYLVAAQGETIVVAELRARLRSALPDYMMPAHFVVLDTLPLNANGKLDRKALPVPGAAEATQAYVAPRDEVEQQLASIWTELLKLPRIGVNDNFFELGGHSLLAAQAMTRVRKHFEIAISVADFFEAQTVAEFAQKLAPRLRERSLLAQLTSTDRPDAEEIESFVF